MKKAFTKANPKDRNHTSFVGYLQVPYEVLTNSFSFPNDCTREDEWRSGDQKVRVEWAFKTKGRKPTVITIYDYKDPRPIEYVDMWHVGFKGDRKKLEAFFKKEMLLVMPH